MATVAMVLSSESDRGCVLSGGTLIDDGLELALRAKFQADSGLHVKSAGDSGELIRKLLFEGQQPPIGTPYVRINLCRALGIIDAETMKALHEFRSMRNNAAHLSEDFVIDKKCVDLLFDALTEKRKTYVRNTVAAVPKTGPNDDEDILERARFAATALHMHYQLADIADNLSDVTQKKSS